MATRSKAEGLLSRQSLLKRSPGMTKADALLSRLHSATPTSSGSRADRLFRRHGKGCALKGGPPAVAKPVAKPATMDSQPVPSVATRPAVPVPSVAAQPAVTAASEQTAEARAKLHAAAAAALKDTTRGAATRTLLKLATTDADLRSALLAAAEGGSQSNLAKCAAGVVDAVWTEQQSSEGTRSGRP